ncbi:hypothetical protein PVK06_040110 [Gossypium arboreum]|uniref:RNase H type-1 domain-containing protein n=1 Tax=Gossypium arboreum TaxID=29729 RepID=A0ABR0N5C1_GOSAR|nr:hypothetical protein PVK06_040110 [Gossypium arboreum]
MRVSSRLLPETCWNPPDLGVIKINFNANFQCDSRTSTSAVIARNYKGDFVGAETYLFSDMVDAFMAEARVCERALLFAINMGFRHLVVEDFDEISYLFVPRLVNSVAQTLAMECRRRRHSGFWIDEVPDSVKMLVTKDQTVWAQRHHGSS